MWPWKLWANSKPQESNRKGRTAFKTWKWIKTAAEPDPSTRSEPKYVDVLASVPSSSRTCQHIFRLFIVPLKCGNDNIVQSLNKQPLMALNVTQGDNRRPQLRFRARNNVDEINDCQMCSCDLVDHNNSSSHEDETGAQRPASSSVRTNAA